VLPEQLHEQFLAEYEAAAEGAQRVEGYRALHDLLRLWGWVPIEDIVPDWPDRLRRR
jgi:hypothetical protein